MSISNSIVLSASKAIEETGIDRHTLSFLGEYRFTDMTSNKFYCFYVVIHNGDKYFMTSWGRIGSRGSTKKHSSAQSALKVVKEKISKGYKKFSGMDTIILDTIQGWDETNPLFLPDEVHGKKDIYRLSMGGATDVLKILDTTPSASKSSVADFLENLRKL